MPSGKEYAKLYGQAKIAYCEGKLEDAAVIIKDMIGRYPEDANVILLQGHIHLGLQQYSLARESYEKVLQLAKNLPNRSDMVAYAQRGLDRIRQLPFEDKDEDSMIAATEAIAYSEADFDPGQGLSNSRSGESEAAAPDWQNEGMDGDSDLFNEGDIGRPTVAELSSTDTIGESTFVIDPEPTLYRQAAKTGRNQGRVTQKKYEEEDTRDFREPKRNDEDLDGFSPMGATDLTQGLGDSDLFTRSGEEALSGGLAPEPSEPLNARPGVGEPDFNPSPPNIPDDKRDSHLPNASERLLKPVVEVNPGKLAFFVNASLSKKQLILAALAGITPVVLIFAVSTTSWLSSLFAAKPAPNRQGKTEKVAPKPAPASLSPFSQLILTKMLVTGVGTFAVTWLGLQLLISQIKRSLKDLQSQFDHLSEGNFNNKATIYSEDEFGQLANRFNQVTRVVVTTTKAAQSRAAETEREGEDLQRQVIRLLDDVEGAARGDLTVEAEVSADVLGAVADAFNSTIQNLREIVRQVKKAAKQVNQGTTDSESFARKQSSEALWMAEELAETLELVQRMTESIQGVADNARVAEEIARDSSVTALEGGDCVERTGAGIRQIRETVLETERKVKRLAVAAQEISKIVAVISQIASRTNVLAVNASIQEARAGETGRGFAIVADEVRQLADRSAKSLKEIEQIVVQIQEETAKVVAIIAEGIEQVKDVTKRSEQAKKSLGDIIQVSNRIETLVRSINADTVKQRENSLHVAQVMQSVELTAQETSQESQRVAGSLQKLVSISQELLSSVEQFKVDSEDNK
ncbi:MAG: hypothetical protein RLZZ143_2180 [Cyanobacteriota bacterium]|jgi:twitching motility protein PilJ